MTLIDPSVNSSIECYFIHGLFPVVCVRNLSNIGISTLSVDYYCKHTTIVNSQDATKLEHQLDKGTWLFSDAPNALKMTIVMTIQYNGIDQQNVPH